MEEANERTRREWQTKVTWVKPQANISTAFLICRQLDNLWSVATAYYTAGGQGSIKSHAMTEEQVRVAINGPGSEDADADAVSITVPSMSILLLYRARSPD